MDLAEDAGEIGNAYVTVCVYAAIAAAVTLTASRLELYSTGDHRAEAVALLCRVQPDGHELAGQLSAPLGMKTKAGYTHCPVTAQERIQAGRRAHALVDAVRGPTPGLSHGPRHRARRPGVRPRPPTQPRHLRDQHQSKGHLTSTNTLSNRHCSELGGDEGTRTLNPLLANNRHEQH